MVVDSVVKYLDSCQGTLHLQLRGLVSQLYRCITFYRLVIAAILAWCVLYNFRYIWKNSSDNFTIDYRWNDNFVIDISYLLLLSSWKSLALSLDSDQLAASKRYYAISRCTALNILDYEWHWTAQPALRKIFLPLEAQYWNCFLTAQHLPQVEQNETRGMFPTQSELIQRAQRVAAIKFTTNNNK